MRNMINQDKC